MARWDEARGCYRITADTRVAGKRSRIVQDVRLPQGPRGARKAAEAEAKLRAEVRAGRVQAGSFEEYAGTWLTRRGARTRPWGDRTYRLHVQVLRDHVYPYIGGALLSDLARDRGPIVDMFAAWATTPIGRKGDHPSPAVIRRWGSIVRTVFAEAMFDGKITTNPVYRAMPGGPADEKVIPTPTEVGDLVAVARSVDAGLFFHVAAGTGARAGSIRSLTWRDVKFDDRTITFRVTKMSKPYTVAIDDRLAAALRDARTRAREIVIATPGVSARIDDRHVFTSDVDGAVPWNASAASHAFKAAADRLELAPGISLHSLRHFHATQLLAVGIPSKDVAARLGCTESNVIRTYSHLVTSTRDRDAATAIGGLLAGIG